MVILRSTKILLLVLTLAIHVIPSIDGINDVEDSKGRRSSSHVYRESSREFTSHESILKEQRVHPNQIHDVIIGIQQKHMDKLTDILHDISNPMSANYGNHMTRQEIADLTTSPESRNQVVAYLKTVGASIISETLYGEYITARAPIHVWEKTFNTEFYTYTRKTTTTITTRNITSELRSIPFPYLLIPTYPSS